MQRIAVPMIGGMITSSILTLIVIPALYGLLKTWMLRRHPSVDPIPDEEEAPAPQPAIRLVAQAGRV